MGKTYVGVSGWSYESWRPSFYPGDLPRSQELHYTSRRFGSVEINGSFYGLLRPDTYRDWHRETPPGFVLAVKGSRFITHNKKLRDAKTPLANFFASGILALGSKLGPILWQLPASHRFDPERLQSFLDLLPRDTRAAARLAHRHDSRVSGRSWMKVEQTHRIRHVLEVRHPSFFSPAFARLARRAGVALAFADSGEWPYAEEITAGFIYLRLHGSPRTYASRYSDQALDDWARRIRAWRRGDEPRDARRLTQRAPPRRKSRDVYVYFDNDQDGHAPHDALRLAERLE